MKNKRQTWTYEILDSKNNWSIWLLYTGILDRRVNKLIQQEMQGNKEKKKLLDKIEEKIMQKVEKAQSWSTGCL